MATQTLERTAEETAREQQQDRIARAAVEGRDYAISYHAPLGKWLVENPHSAKKTPARYLVNDETCSCEDFAYRCAGKGLKCKHQIAVSVYRLLSK